MPGLLNEQEYNAQFHPGRGVSMRYGPKPLTADEVAPRGTKEWREAWKAMDAWRGNQLKQGATAWDLGLRDEKSLGQHFFTRIREGQVDPRARGDWMAAANSGNFDRGVYRPNDTNFYGGMPNSPSGGLRGILGGGAAPVGPSGMAPIGPASPTPYVQPTDSYLQMPRGGKRRSTSLRTVLGG